jgi:HEAT repeat protein
MIVWKEWRETLPLLVAAGLGICVISHLKWDGWRDELFEVRFWFVTVLCLIFFTPFLGAAAVAGEREEGTFDLLLARPVGLTKLFLVKYFIRLAGVIVLLLALLATFSLIRPTHNFNLYNVARGLAILASFLTFVLTVSFLVSCFSDTSSKAYIAGIALVYVILFIVTATRYFHYAWWWRNSLSDMWLGYTFFYTALSAIGLILCGALFVSRIAFSITWKHLTVAGALIFVTFIGSTSTTFGSLDGISGRLDLDLERIARGPVGEILDETSKLGRADRWNNPFWNLLIQSSDFRLEKELVKELKNPEGRIRNEAVKILTRRKAKHLKADIIPLLRDPHTDVRLSVLEFVTWKKCEEAAPYIIDMLEDSDSTFRQRAVRTLPLLMGKDAGPYLMSALLDKTPWVQSVAVRELCKLDHTEAREEVIRLMFESPVDYVRYGAASDLGYMKSAPACGELMNVLHSDDNKVVHSAISSLGNLKCEDSLDTLIAMLGTRNWNDIALYPAIRKIAGPRAKEIFTTMFAEGDPGSRAKIESAIALAEMGDAAGIPYMRELLEREVHKEPGKSYVWNQDVRRLAAAGEIATVPVLIKYMNDTRPRDSYRHGKRLEILTGKNYGWDIAKWQKWWEKNKDELMKDMLSGNVPDGAG